MSKSNLALINSHFAIMVDETRRVYIVRQSVKITDKDLLRRIAQVKQGEINLDLNPELIKQAYELCMKHEREGYTPLPR